MKHNDMNTSDVPQVPRPGKRAHQNSLREDAERSANATPSLSRSKKSNLKQCEVRGNPYETQSHEHTGRGASATSGQRSPPFKPLGLVRRTDQNAIEKSIEKAVQKSVAIKENFMVLILKKPTKKKQQ